jgi:hypothetical protein
MSVKCKVNEVVVPQHCRRKTSPSKKSNKEKLAIMEYLDESRLENKTYEEEEFVIGIMKTVVDVVPLFVADVVVEMSRFRKEYQDVHVRYKKVSAKVAEERVSKKMADVLLKSRGVKQAVFAILAKQRV